MAVAVTAPHRHGGPGAAFDKMASLTSRGLRAQYPSARPPRLAPPIARRPLQDAAVSHLQGRGSRPWPPAEAAVGLEAAYGLSAAAGRRQPGVGEAPN